VQKSDINAVLLCMDADDCISQIYLPELELAQRRPTSPMSRAVAVAGALWEWVSEAYSLASGPSSGTLRGRTR